MGQEDSNSLGRQQPVLAVVLLGHRGMSHAGREGGVADAKCAAQPIGALDEADDSSLGGKVERALHQVDIATSAGKPEKVALDLVF